MQEHRKIWNKNIEPALHKARQVPVKLYQNLRIKRLLNTIFKENWVFGIEPACLSTYNIVEKIESREKNWKPKVKTLNQSVIHFSVLSIIHFVKFLKWKATILRYSSEAAPRRCAVRKVSLKVSFQAYNFIKTRFLHSCFPLHFPKFLRIRLL